MGVLEDDGKPIELSLLQCLLFGCIISAVDPVAVLAIFQEVTLLLFMCPCIFRKKYPSVGWSVGNQVFIISEFS